MSRIGARGIHRSTWQTRQTNMVARSTVWYPLRVQAAPLGHQPFHSVCMVSRLTPAHPPLHTNTVPVKSSGRSSVHTCMLPQTCPCMSRLKGPSQPSPSVPTALLLSTTPPPSTLLITLSTWQAVCDDAVHEPHAISPRSDPQAPSDARNRGVYGARHRPHS